MTGASQDQKNEESRAIPHVTETVATRIPRDMAEILRTRAASEKKSLSRFLAEIIAAKLDLEIPVRPVRGGYRSAIQIMLTEADHGRLSMAAVRRGLVLSSMLRQVLSRAKERGSFPPMPQGADSLYSWGKCKYKAATSVEEPVIRWLQKIRTTRDDMPMSFLIRAIVLNFLETESEALYFGASDK